MNIKQYIKELKASRQDVVITFIDSNVMEQRITVGQLCDIALSAINQRDIIIEQAQNNFSVHPKILQSNLSNQKKSYNKDLLKVLGY